MKLISRIHVRLRGWRTVMIFGALAAAGLLEQLGTLDLSPLFDALGVPEARRSLIVTGMAALAIVLRWATATPIGQTEPTTTSDDRP